MALVSTGLELLRRPAGAGSCLRAFLNVNPRDSRSLGDEGDGTTERNENGKRKKNVFLFHKKSKAEERNTEEERVELEPSDEQH